MNQKFTEGQEVQSKFKNFPAIPRFSGLVVEVIRHVYGSEIDYWVEAENGQARHFSEDELELTEWQGTLDRVEAAAEIDAVKELFSEAA